MAGTQTGVGRVVVTRRGGAGPLGQAENTSPTTTSGDDSVTPDGSQVVGLSFGQIFQEAMVLTAANGIGGAAMGALTSNDRKRGALKGAVVGATVLPVAYGLVTSARIMLNAPPGVSMMEAHKANWITAGAATVIGAAAWGLSYALGLK